jgi:membrane protein
VSLRRLPPRAALLLRKGGESLIREAGTRDAAQVAYFLVMSFPAILLLLVWSFSAVLEDESVRQAIVDSIVEALPLADASDRREVEALLDDVAAGAGSLGWIGAVALLYSASGAIGALRHAVNRAWGAHDPPYAPAKALDAGLTLIVAPTLIVGLGLELSGSVTTLVPLALLLAVLVALFRVLPAARGGIRAALIGGAVALAGIVLVQLGAEAYFSGFGDTSAVYGTLGVLLAVVFSAYLDAVAIVYGAYVAAQASVLPTGASIDLAIEREKGVPAARHLLAALRGLFVRSRSRRSGPG